MTVRYAVSACYPAIDAPEGFELAAFDFSLVEAFALIMSRTVDRYQFRREDGVMRLQIAAPVRREPLPIDACYPVALGDPFTSAHPDDAAAREEIMERVGAKDWYGLSLERYRAPLTPVDLLRNLNASERAPPLVA